MPNRIKNISHSCRSIDKAIANMRICIHVIENVDGATHRDVSETRQCADDAEDYMNDVRSINEELRSLATEYSELINDLQSVEDDQNLEIEILHEEIKELKFAVEGRDEEIYQMDSEL